MTEHKLTASHHAYGRAKQRFRWSRRTLRRMMIRAFNKGISYDSAKGKLRLYMIEIFHKTKEVNNARVYGENIYLFSDTHLVTLYRLNQYLIKYIKL